MSDEDVEDVEVEEEEEVEEAEEEEGMQPTLLSVELDESLDHAVVQLPSKLMRELGLSEGSVVRLKGKRRSKTVCTVMKGPGLKGMMARMGTSALRNLRLKDGQVLRVEEDVSGGKKGAPPAALTVTIAPFSVGRGLPHPAVAPPTPRYPTHHFAACTRQPHQTLLITPHQAAPSRTQPRQPCQPQLL